MVSVRIILTGGRLVADRASVKDGVRMGQG